MLNWLVFRLQLTLLKEIFQKNCYFKNLTNRSSRKGSYRREEAPSISSLLRNCISLNYGNLQKSIKVVLYFCKLQVIFKSYNELLNNFRFRDDIPQILTSGVVYKFQCGLCNEYYYWEYFRQRPVRNGEQLVF